MQKKKKKRGRSDGEKQKDRGLCVRGGGCLKLALHSGVLGNERDTSRFGVFVAITRKHQMNSLQAMCAGLCMHERVCVCRVSVYTYGCVSVEACGCMCVCVHVHVCGCVCEQVAGIFEDDSRGLTHARPNKAAL